MRRRRSQGFTLIELMMVITIIAVLLILARPGMGGWQMSSRQYDLTLEIANMGRRAASRARETGTAHQLRLSTVNSRFNLEIYQGMTRRCRQTNWFVLGLAVPFLIQRTDYGIYARAAETETLAVTFQRYLATAVPDGAPLDAMEICYEPSGKTYTSLGTLASMVRQSSPLEAFVSRIGGSSQRTRVVSFPPAGTPRQRL